MDGPKKPPRFPSELIQAMLAAAAMPVRNIGGIDQNGPLLPENPIAAIDMPTRDHTVPTVRPAMTRPMVETMHARQRFHRRSPIRSEIAPQVSMLMAPQA